MSTPLADPGFEPTDEELQELSRAAFSDAERRHQDALLKLHAKIRKAREQLRASSHRTS